MITCTLYANTHTHLTHSDVQKLSVRDSLCLLSSALQRSYYCRASELDEIHREDVSSVVWRQITSELRTSVQQLSVETVFSFLCSLIFGWIIESCFFNLSEKNTLLDQLTVQSYWFCLFRPINDTFVFNVTTFIPDCSSEPTIHHLRAVFFFICCCCSRRPNTDTSSPNKISLFLF